MQVATRAPFGVQDIERTAKVFSLILSRETLLRVAERARRVSTACVDCLRVFAACSLGTSDSDAARAQTRRTRTRSRRLTRCSARTRAAACACIPDTGATAGEQRPRRRGVLAHELR